MNLVRIYRNLHKKLYSVQEKVEGRWKVVEHTNNINIRNVSFKVSEGGRQRVLSEKRKNVHAFIIGERVSSMTPSVYPGDEITYNPYASSHFATKYKNIPLDKAKFVSITCGKITAWLSEFEGKYI